MDNSATGHCMCIRRAGDRIYELNGSCRVIDRRATEHAFSMRKGTGANTLFVRGKNNVRA